MDRARMIEGIRVFLEGIGERFPGDDLEATPERVARAWQDELLSGYGDDPVRELTWTEVDGVAGLVVVRDIRFASVCVHHLLPFAGVAHVAYLPSRRLAGLSKLGRVIDAHSRRLQIQERLTAKIVETIDAALEPRGTVVMLEAEHTCMTLRGVRKESSRLVTIAASRLFDSDLGARREAIAAMLAGRGVAGGAAPA